MRLLQGHSVEIFERHKWIGGVWQYSEVSEEDGKNKVSAAGNAIVHSSL